MTIAKKTVMMQLQMNKPTCAAPRHGTLNLSMFSQCHFGAPWAINSQGHQVPKLKNYQPQNS